MQNAKEILSKANKLSIKITTPIKFGCIITPTFYILKPLIIDIFNYFIYDIQPSRKVPLKAKYFYDIAKSPLYEFTYFLQAYGTLLVCAFIVSIITLFQHYSFYGICVSYNSLRWDQYLVNFVSISVLILKSFVVP